MMETKNMHKPWLEKR